MSEDWKEASMGNVVKLEEGQALTGKFVSIEESKQYPGSYAFKVETETDVKVTFVNSIVKELIESNNIMKGQDVRLIFKGMKENEQGTRSYKDYSLLFRA